MAELLDVSQMIAPAYQPKVENRWIIAWDGLDAFTAKAFNRPSLQFQEVVIDYINTKRYFQGKFEWQTITLELYDPIVPSAAQRVQEWVRLGFENLTGRAGYKEFAVARGFVLNLLDPPGSVIESWSFINLQPMSVNYGALSYDSSTPCTVQLTLRYDAAILLY